MILSLLLFYPFSFVSLLKFHVKRAIFSTAFLRECVDESNFAQALASEPRRMNSVEKTKREKQQRKRRVKERKKALVLKGKKKAAAFRSCSANGPSFK